MSLPTLRETAPERGFASRAILWLVVAVVAVIVFGWSPPTTAVACVCGVAFEGLFVAKEAHGVAGWVQRAVAGTCWLLVGVGVCSLLLTHGVGESFVDLLFAGFALTGGLLVLGAARDGRASAVP